MSSARIGSLDGLRAGSIVFVLYGHLVGTHGFPDVGALRLALGDMANLGVNVFFIISGFLITSLLIGERHRTGRVSLKGFYWRRALRLLPAAYAFLLAIVIAGQLGWIEIGREDLVVAATYLVNYDTTRAWSIGHLWSLSVEEQFYLLWPIGFVLLSERHALIAATLTFALAPVVRTIMHVAFAHTAYADLEIFPAVADGIAIGCVFALLRPWLLAQAWYLRCTASRWLWLLLPLIVVVNRARNHTIVDALAWPCMLVATAVLIEASTRRRGTWSWKILNWPPIAFVGTLSYSLYLWQQPFLNRHMDAWATAFPVNLLLAIMAALASYFLIERPFLRLRRSKPVELEGPDATTANAAVAASFEDPGAASSR